MIEAGDLTGPKLASLAMRGVNPPVKETAMPLFMDVHNGIPDGATPSDVAAAHQADLRVQDKYDVKYRSYWLDEQAGKVFCLVEAPDAEAAQSCHREAHGLVADEIYEVVQG